MTTTLQYALPTDDLAPSYTPTLETGTQDSEYPIANLSSEDPSNPWKTTDTTFRLVWDFTSAKTVKAVALIHANFQAALANVKFQMNSSDAWGSPAFSRSFTIGAYGEDGYPPNPYLDLTDVSPSYRYASLVASTANVVAIAIGRFIMSSALRELSGFVSQKEPSEDEQHPAIENQTDAGVVSIYSYGVRRRWYRGVMLESNTNVAALRSWRRACFGRLHPFLLLAHLDPDEAWYARFENDKLSRGYVEGSDGLSYVPEGFEEVSRGLKPTPSAV